MTHEVQMEGVTFVAAMAEIRESLYFASLDAQHNKQRKYKQKIREKCIIIEITILFISQRTEIISSPFMTQHWRKMMSVAYGLLV